MKKFKVYVNIQGYDIYEINAVDKDQAREEVLSGNYEPMNKGLQQQEVTSVEVEEMEE
jgi:hypothetical protein